MADLLRAEGIKLRKSTSFWVLIMVSIAFTALIVVMFINFAAELATEGEAVTGVENFYTAIKQASFNLILISVLSALFICAEFNNRTFGLSLFSGHSRRKLMAAKISMLLIGSIILTTIMPVLMLIVFSALNGFGGSVGDLALPMLRDFGLYTLGNVTLAAFCALLSYAIRSSGGATGACIGITLALNVLTSFQTASTARIIKFSFMTQLMQVGDRALNIPFYIGVMVVTLAAALIGTAVIFKNAELK